MEGDFQYPASGLSRWLQWLWRGIRAVAACVCPLWVLQPQFFIASVRVGRTRASMLRSTSYAERGKRRATICLREDYDPPWNF